MMNCGAIESNRNASLLLHWELGSPRIPKTTRGKTVDTIRKTYFIIPIYKHIHWYYFMWPYIHKQHTHTHKCMNIWYSWSKTNAPWNTSPPKGSTNLPGWCMQWWRRFATVWQGSNQQYVIHQEIQVGGAWLWDLWDANLGVTKDDNAIPNHLMARWSSAVRSELRYWCVGHLRFCIGIF